MPDFTINVRSGGARQSTAEQAPEFVAKKLVDVLRKAAEQKGIERVLEALIANEAAIIRDITKDADKFGAQAARVFTRVRSGIGSTTSISLDDISQRTGTLVSSNNRLSDRLKGKTTVEWLSLRKQTIAAKRRRMTQKRKRKHGAKSAGEPDTFFVDSGALRDTLTAYLGPAMALLVDPKVIVRRGPRKVTVTLSIMAQASGREKAGVSAQSLPQANGGATPSDSESLFIRYLKKAGATDDRKSTLANKLQNPRGRHRPFLQNTLVFWISNRMPLVLEKSLRTALSKRIKKGT